MRVVCGSVYLVIPTETEQSSSHSFTSCKIITDGEHQLPEGKTPGRKWNAFWVLSAGSLLREAACGMAAAFSPEESPESEGRKGNSATEQRCRELVDVTKRHKSRSLWDSYCRFPVRHSVPRIYFSAFALCTVSDKRRWPRLIMPNFRLLIEVPK